MYWILLLVLPFASGYSNGPTINDQNFICTNVQPNHGPLPQRNRFHSMQVEPLNNGAVRVTVSGETVLGVILQARSGTQPTGSFIQIPQGYRGWTCGGIADNTVTHNTRGQSNQVSFLWVPDSNSPSTVTFKGAAVKSFTEISGLEETVRI